MSGSPDAALRRNLATAYLAFFSIVVALAAEGLLTRLGEIESLSTPNAVNAAILCQSAVALLLAAACWWVTARWAITVPWQFGFFDVLSPFVLLVAFHLVVGQVGSNPRLWLAAVGALSIAAGATWAINVRRAVGGATFASLARVIWPTAGFPIGAGAAVVLLCVSPESVLESPMFLIAFGVTFSALIVGFSFAEERAWRKVADAVGQPSSG